MAQMARLIDAEIGRELQLAAEIEQVLGAGMGQALDEIGIDRTCGSPGQNR